MEKTQEADHQLEIVPSGRARTAPPAVTENEHDGQTSARQNAASRKSDIGILDDENKKKRKRGDEDEDQRPWVPIKELREAMESRGGSGAVFLYETKLASADVVKNWLLVTREERVREFLKVEEAAAVDGEGLTVVGVDGVRGVYMNLKIKSRGESKLVIKENWKHLVVRNNARNGDTVEIWGYRENGKACLAFNFRRKSATSSTSNVRRDESAPLG